MKLPIEIWQSKQSAHQERVDHWVKDRQARKQRGERHPVDDFLFEYYPYSITKLRTWHPGYGITLLGSREDVRDYLERTDYRETQDGCTADPEKFTKHRARKDLVIRLLSQTQDKSAHLNCFGMHEWAMVYGQQPDEIRHTGVPLRLSPDQIQLTVDSIGLRCTHIDAYRFFTPQAMPMNAHTPTRENQPEMEQPGCLHANMDLYKYAIWFTPFISSELIADCFDLARTARTLDMKASPYELASYELQPIALETAEGRREYIAQQTRIMQAAEPLRQQLLAALIELPA